MQEVQAKRYFWQSAPFEEYPTLQLARVSDYSWYDESALEGFEGDIADILGQNPSLSEEFIAAACRLVRKNIETVSDATAEALGCHCILTRDAAAYKNSHIKHLTPKEFLAIA